MGADQRARAPRVWGELRRLSETEMSAAREALTGPDGAALIRLMADLSMHARPNASLAVRTLASELGWMSRPNAPIPTDLGLKVGDSCREFVMWEARGRRIHEADRLEVMHEGTFRGRRVAELGCGFGCNLLSLAGVAAELVGVELEPVYVQLSPVLAGIAGFPPPRIVESGADATGLEAARYDVVLNLGALQYMPIEAVLAETSRILVAGGTAVMILSHLGGFLRVTASRLPRMPGRARARELVTVAGMLAYPWLGRAFTRPSDPVYPTHARMRRWLDAVGMTLDPGRTTVFGHETCYVAIKR